MHSIRKIFHKNKKQKWDFNTQLGKFSRKQQQNNKHVNK